MQARRLHHHRHKHGQAIALSILALFVCERIVRVHHHISTWQHNDDGTDVFLLPGQDHQKSNSSGLIPFNFELEHSLLQYMHQQRLALINESSVTQYRKIYNHFNDEMIMTMRSAPWLIGVGAQCPYNNETLRENFLYIFTTNLKNKSQSDILSGEGWGTLCCTMNGFFATGGIKKHVLLSTVDSNWGEFSDYVPNRTGAWSNHHECYDHDKYYQYLNHPNVSLVVTVQHQHFDHPKVLSLPLGQQSNAAGALQKQSKPDWVFFTNRTNLLLINCAASPTRKPILERVIANFGGNITNRKDPKHVDEYFHQLSTSKYILSPSGIGWDCYRTWEAIILGCIPILETYYRKDGLYRTYDDLPVLWVDHYDNVTPSLLEREYPRVLSRAREYKFEKLTSQWWIDLINRHRS